MSGFVLHVWSFTHSLFPAGPGQLVNALASSGEAGGKAGRQAAGKAWWLLNRGFEDLFISD